ncbi:uncharacterized protein LOC122369088 isoform X3 [Amphibalanus amphitrite]|uniref:uncharacterized protein LOC122369088 isoform X3 n=1 Tax=Amphibalanus amphitrite TaxID=1232801 RepID=UPI001C8FFCE1|nr:uncharacterized protein LOC122369088 isoform X3 [Amphibalanus amphitrite]
MLLLSENEYHEVKGKGGHSYILCERMGMFPNIHKKRLVCQHYARQKPGKTCKASPRDTGCPVTLDIRVRKVTFQKNAKSRSKKPDAGYALQVKARGQHNHPLETATVLKFRRVSERTRERIVELFRHHHSPATALRTLKLQLQAEYGERYPLIAADRGILPDTNYFYKLHKKFLASECGEQRTAGSIDQQPTAGSVNQQPSAGSVDQQPSADSIVNQQPPAGSVDQQPSAGSVDQQPSAAVLTSSRPRAVLTSSRRRCLTVATTRPTTTATTARWRRRMETWNRAPACLARTTTSRPCETR